MALAVVQAFKAPGFSGILLLWRTGSGLVGFSRCWSRALEHRLGEAAAHGAELL